MIELTVRHSPTKNTIMPRSVLVHFCFTCPRFFDNTVECVTHETTHSASASPVSAVALPPPPPVVVAAAMPSSP